MSAPAKSGRTLILGHRGASAHLPENTLASYEAAIKEGADGIESGESRTFRTDVGSYLGCARYRVCVMPLIDADHMLFLSAFNLSL
jgi:hypothetical protein